MYAGVDDMLSSFMEREGGSSENEVEMHLKQYHFNLKKVKPIIALMLLLGSNCPRSMVTAHAIL